ncbi:MAG: hypothetical protein KC656_02145 [Myxococcales bacterium]|nr:hypothetical protein [Myxococcales bacterium]
MDVLTPLLVSAPVWLVLLVGIVYGALTLRLHRVVSQLAIVALTGFLVLDLVGTLVWTAYEWFVAARGGKGLSVWVTNGFFVLQTLAHAFCLALAIGAAAWDRRPRAGE